ncbi:MarR family winged helix-turn-helix transcriptional regulator [Promicromonospora sukumoe]|uniref:MarR family winged helix-turn-helix transcriptional regulator n=1 Tax=Promicromonospora sukumoe TaxID=88382 RepID=UPI00037ED334|nr:MarR family winged helix-turn-helix transcriptional regulator [Promicromonospora sukumoe]
MADENQPNTDAPLLALLQRGVRHLTDEFLVRLSDAGVASITPAHAAVLAHLDAEEAVSTAELARRADVTRQTMHRAVTQLIGEGLLSSEPGPGFPRSTRIALTPAGQQRRDLALGILRDLEVELGDRLGSEAVAGLRATMSRAWPH